MAKPKQVDIEDLTYPAVHRRFRSAYDGQFDRVSKETAFVPTGNSLTRQEFKEEADINTIVRRFGLTGELPPVVRVPTYGDFSEVSDFRSALHVVMEAEEAFMRLPAALRARFQNDPQALMEFVADKSNIEEARALGLLKPTQEVPTPLSAPAEPVKTP